MNVLQLEDTLPHEYEMNMIYEHFGISFMDSVTKAAADPVSTLWSGAIEPWSRGTDGYKVPYPS